MTVVLFALSVFGIAHAGLVERFHSCQMALGSTTDAVFESLGSHRKALNKLRLSPEEQKFVDLLVTKRIKIGIDELKGYERSESLHSKVNDTWADNVLYFTVQRWPNKAGMKRLGKILVNRMGFHTHDGNVFRKTISDGKTKSNNLYLDVSIEYSSTRDSKWREVRREGVLRVRVVKLGHERDRLEFLNFPVVNMATNLAVQHLANELHLSLDEILSVKPSMGGLENTNWIDFYLGEIPFSLIAIMYIPKILTLNASEFTAVEKTQYPLH